MKTKTHGMRVVSLLAIGAMLWVISPCTPATAGIFDADQAGTMVEGCDEFSAPDKPTFEGGKALSADLFEYNFSAKMKIGFDLWADKGEKRCTAIPCTAKVVTKWDSKTGQASENYAVVCPSLTTPSFTLTTLVTCPKDPWVSNVDVLRSCSKTPIVTGSYRFNTRSAPVYPLTAYMLGAEGRDRIAALNIGRGSSDFILPPALPPEIIVDGMAGSDSMSFSRGQSAKIAIVRPPDGSPQWYSKPWKYDVEIQVKRAMKIVHHVDSWVMLPGSISAVEGVVPKTSLTLPYSSLFIDDKSNWNIETVGVGKYRTIQIRARIQSFGAWSGWRRFWVEPPLTMAPGTAKPLNTPATQQQINQMQKR